MKRGACEIHFQGSKDSTIGVTCLIIVSNAASEHLAFTQRMKQFYGKVPSVGIPRISRTKPGQTRFTVTDPAHNSIIFITRGNEDNEVYTNAERKDLSPLQKALALAIRLRDLKLDYPAALKVIEKGLRHVQEEKTLDFARALHVKADLAFLMNDLGLQQRVQIEIAKISLTSEQQESIKKEFHV
jgi:hypothetical protein